MKLINNKQYKNLIGKRLKTARLKNNLTQQQVSIKLQTMGVYIDRASISKIEQCKRIVTDYELVAFSKLLGVSVSWLLGIEKE
ncbi:helix-turn-helix domain-containing protein [Caloranaerobacter azorensis]|uniref:Helix-turn-helix transcriptional regulator n=1 Tax=Caloranaerobacter azorensis TaxID=116090 RepID=A0A6P1YGB0_9FIRM|nr:helix-turn-helix transcriptional regulator [Caloranaerobacter azorensis]QIB27803.1 helix-turn-helix transcriptional regulator [Caloranaerobacter azorensis]